MATTNNAVTVTAGLTCTALANPPIGAPSTAASIGYQDGDTATDTYSIAANASATTLFTASDDGFVYVYNPSGNSYAVTVTVGAQAMGPLPPGFACVFPVSSGVAVKVQSATADQYVGYTHISTAANA